MMEVKPVTLTGKVVRLEPLSEAHVPGLTAVGLNDEIWRWMPYGVMKNEDDIRRLGAELVERESPAVGADAVCCDPFGIGTRGGRDALHGYSSEGLRLGDRRDVVWS